MLLMLGGIVLFIGTLYFFVLGPRPWAFFSLPGPFIGFSLAVLSGRVAKHPGMCRCQKQDPLDVDDDEEADLNYCD